MRPEYGHIPTSNPSLRIIRSALTVGSLAFVAGFLGPIYFSESNLGPLLGIFYTGPVGTLAGALWGVVRSAKVASATETRAVLTWLLAIWVLTLLYTLFLLGFSGSAAPPAIGVQGLIVGTSAFLLYGSGVRERLSAPLRRCGPVVLTALVLIFLMTVFPPVRRNWWDPQSKRQSAGDTTPLPTVAFILDKRFDSSKGVPMFAVDRRTLVREWVIVALTALGGCLLMTRWRGYP